jgi:hypothetical protein
LEEDMTTARKIAIVSVAVVSGFLLSFGHYTHRGYINVVETGGSLRLLDHGLHFRPPWQKVTTYPIRCCDVRVEILDEGPEATIHFEAVFYVSIRRDSIPSLHRAYRGAYMERVVSPMLSRFLRDYGEGYGLWDGDLGPQRIRSIVLDYLAPEAARYGINITEMWLRTFEVETMSGSF